MKFVERALLCAAALSLSACAASSYCLGEQDYQKAKSVPALQPAGDLKIAESASSLKIPPEPATKVPYGEKIKDAQGEEVTSCLDKPPQMVAAAEPAAAPAPAPVAAPAKVETPPEAVPAETPPPAPAKPAAPAKKKKKPTAAAKPAPAQNPSASPTETAPPPATTAPATKP